MDKLFVNFLPPWVETNIQPAFYDKESGSVLQQTARMYAKVNCLVRMFNKLSKETKETVEDYIARFVALKDFVDTYFDNLDVQEEINNKLDDMVEAGTLQEIITTYIQANVEWTFDNVADMKNATNLVNGSYTRTLGYYSKGDNGGALYYIDNTGTANDGDIIAIGDLRAHLCVNETTVEMFGAKGDGVTNDTDAFEKCIEYSDAINLKTDATYKITNLDIEKSLVINGNNATLSDITSTDKFISNESLTGSKAFTLCINNLKLVVAHCNYGIYTHSNVTKLNNVTVEGALDSAVAVYKGTTAGRYGDLEINNITCGLCQTGLYISASDCFINDYHGYNCKTHIDVRRGLTHINTAHGWNFNTGGVDWVTGSCLINIVSDVVMNDIYSDTLEATFVLPTGYQYTTIQGTNINQFLNTSSYPNTQASPLLVKNIENYTGWIKLVNISANANNWRDSDNEMPVLFPSNTFSLATKSFENVTSIGYKTLVNGYIPYRLRGDIQPSEIVVNNNTYLSVDRKKKESYQRTRKAFFVMTLRTALPNNTELENIDFTTESHLYGVNTAQQFTKVEAVFVSTSTTGLIYKLDAWLYNNKLTIYNHTGISLNNGYVYCSISTEKID